MFSYIIPWGSEASQHGCNVLENPQLQGGVADPPDHGAGLVWSQSVPQQHPGQQHRAVMRDVAERQQQLIHLLEETEEIRRFIRPRGLFLVPKLVHVLYGGVGLPYRIHPVCL